ncbi:F-box/FBD/LRR-repeat protein At1g13570-like [Bidens hawaiensis]|uniref:F-box/FBD/LRR-repeat protein At1g13570-like n=1 Tax=Bidens hawaiensis TaxID=980011 RepID=UPI00404AB00E
MTTKRLCEADQSSVDRISTLPQQIIETILCLLDSTKEAARTSILSRGWRYKWTTIPELEFDHEKRRVSVQGSDMSCKSCYEIHQVLLLHQGPIHELCLYICGGDGCLELDQIIPRLSMIHTLKKLILSGSGVSPGLYNLPSSVSSFNHLTDLSICYLDLYHPPIFNGFRNLRSLCLREVGIYKKSFLHLLSNCPSLKSLILIMNESDEKYTIRELFGCLPMIEHLTTWPYVAPCLVLDSVPQELPALIHLKCICFEDMCLAEGYGLTILLILIKCSPNLEKIKLEAMCHHDCVEEHSIAWEEYSDVWLEHLNELEIDYFYNSKREMEFVKFILARSPKLKKVSISTARFMDQRTEMSEALLWAPRASAARIFVW